MSHELDSTSYLVNKYFEYRNNIWRTDNKTHKIFLMNSLGTYRLSIGNRTNTDAMNDVEFRKCIELIRAIHYEDT